MYEKLCFSTKVREHKCFYPYSKRTKFYTDVFVEPQVQGWLEGIFRLTLMFLLNRHKERAFIWCFVKFQFYPLNNDEIIIKNKVKDVCKTCITP